MGKTSKWLINFLLGKKEEKGKKMDITFYEESSVTNQSTSVPSTPTYKRRWSFRKSSNNGRAHSHKSSKSLDLITNITPLLTRAVSSLELENRHQNTKALALAIPSRETIKTVVTAINTTDRIRKTVQDAAATRVQAAFRSYLARKALRALKGLVKLQALVRGHLVRKQTTTTMRRMHALIAIQLRARQQRIQLAEESSFVVRSQSSRQYRLPSQVNGFFENHKEDVDANINRMCRIYHKGNERLDNLQIGRIEQGVDITRSSDDLLSMLKQEHRREELHFPTAQNSTPVSPQMYGSVESIPGRASFTGKQLDYLPSVAPPSPSQPNYMANTESSKAKGRSQSEPKRRPKLSMRPTNKQTVSMDWTDVQQDAHMQYPSLWNVQGQDPGFAKIQKSARTKEFHGDAKITNNATNSSHSKFLVTYEPLLNLY